LAWLLLDIDLRIKTTIYMHLIHPQEITAFRAKGDTVFIDARGGADAFARFADGHLEDALFVDLETDLSEKTGNAASGGRHPLPHPATFGKLLGSLGIMPSTTVVAYDDKKGANAAARFWWMMKAVGHEKVFVLDGGLDAVVTAGIPLSIDILTLLTVYPAYPVVDWELGLANLDRVASAADDSDYVVIDVREDYRFRGESEPIDTGNLGPDGKFLTAAEISDKYRKVIGARAPENVIVHCGSGVTACHTLLALAEAGISGPALYVGSWSEWSRNELPIATGN
jgi:thiosulfate/3-mercaptopyruvate sulfurtransferase